jgi:2-keto-4-pentenoate hydratase/2-oxohepta-3-ene-1,7-dioic acid hydratase in catechol pathway
LRIARFANGGAVAYGIVEGDPAEPASLTVTRIAGYSLKSAQRAGEPLPLSAVRLLAPTVPSKVVGFGSNYPGTGSRRAGEEPSLFLKPPTAVVGPDATVRLPPRAGAVWHEGELAVVIGSECRSVPPERALRAVLGYTCANDLTAIELPPSSGDRISRGKVFDTFCPLGPWVETALDPSDLAIECTVNGETRQAGRTSQLITDVPHLIALASEFMTLRVGDVILTGTPPTVGPIEPGDELVVTIEGIGSLANRVGLAP